MSQFCVMGRLALNGGGLWRHIQPLKGCWSYRSAQIRASSSGDSSQKSNRYLEVKNRRSGGEQTALGTDVRPLGEKIKENTKTFTYLTVILVGVGATIIMAWSICKELLSSNSPNNVYSAALERVKQVYHKYIKAD